MKTLYANRDRSLQSVCIQNWGDGRAGQRDWSEERSANEPHCELSCGLTVVFTLSGTGVKR